MNAGLGKILVVDDEVELKNILVESLSTHGYAATGLTSGEEALAILNTESFDIMLTDLMMPSMDGIALVEAALRLDPNLISIVMTGQGTIQTAVDAMKLGAFDYVLKPFRLKTILPGLTRAMNARRLRLENLQLRETVAIHELSQTVSFTLDPQTIISKLADAALQQTEADEVSILLPASEDELYVAAVRGEKRQALLGERVPLCETISGWVVQQREPLLLDGEVADDRFRSFWPQPKIRSAIVMPMQVAGKLIGTININAIDRPRPFSLGQMKALTILASTAAAALESAALYTQVQQAEEKYRSIFENAAEGICRTTPEGKIVTANPAMAHMLGYDSPAELIAAVADLQQDLYVDANRRDEFRMSFETTDTVIGFEAECRRKDGTVVMLSQSARAIRDGNGAVLYYEGIAEDITEHKRALEQLETSEKRFRQLAENINEVFWIVDPTDRQIVYISPAYEQIWGRTRESLVQDPDSFFAAIHPDDREKVMLAAARQRQGQRADDEYRIVQPDGSVRWIHDHAFPVKDESGAVTRIVGIAEDITERKQADAEREKLTAEIERHRERLKNIILAVPGIVWESWEQPDAAAQRTNFISDYVETMLGYSVEEWVSTPNFWLQIIHPDDRERIAKASAEAFTSARSNGTLEFRWLKKDGTPIWVESRSTVTVDDHGGPVGVRGVTTDISERKRAEAALRESEERYRELVENARDIIYSHDLQGNYTSSNKAGEAITGYTLAETLQLNFAQTLSPEGLAKAREMTARKLAGEHVTAYELEILAKDGRRIPVEVNTWLQLEHGVPIGIQGIARDLTDRKRAEAELTRLAAAVEQTADSIVITNVAGRIEYVNPAFERISGYSRKEVIGKNPRILKSGKTEPDVYADLWNTITRGGVWTGQLTNKKKDGTLFNERVTISAVRDESGEIKQFVAVKQDRTHETQLEEQLRQAQKMEAIGQLAGGVAHDFNNLLTAINGYSSLALQRANGNDAIRGYLEEIKKAGDRAANLTRQLLAFGRKQILQPVALNLNDIVTEMTKMLRRLIGEDIVLSAKLDPALKKIKADPGQIEQVLLNLVVNARDAMPQGGNLTIETAMVELDDEYAGRHIGALPGSYAMLAISDNGTGMDDTIQQRIFDPFFTTKDKDKGTGLGLSTVYGIIKQSGGNIWVYSEPGRGTTFKVYLPQLEAQVTPAHDAAHEESAPRGTETILLVEDEEVVRGLARQILEHAGYKVLEAGGGEEAVHLSSEYAGGIDLLLTDVVMPKASGKDIADAIAAMRPQARVLFMSGYTDEAIVHHGVLDSGVEFIQKPFTPASLARKVRDVLESRSHPKTNSH